MSGREGYHQTRASRWQPNERQRLVLDALAEDKTNPEIAALLGVTLDGAKWHVGELLSQTGLADRQELGRWWRGQRERRQLLFAGLSPLKIGLLGVVAGLAVVAGLVLLGRNGGNDRAASNAQLPLPGLDLPATPESTPPTTPPVPAAYYSCPVTLPNGNDPPGETPGLHFGDGVIWAAVSRDGRIVYPSEYVDADGSLSLKWVWWTTIRGGDFSVEAVRLDGPGTFVRGDFDPGVAGGGTPVWVGGPRFSDAGCWRMTARVNEQSLTVVFFLQFPPLAEITR